MEGWSVEVVEVDVMVMEHIGVCVTLTFSDRDFGSDWGWIMDGGGLGKRIGDVASVALIAKLAILTGHMEVLTIIGAKT